MILWVANIDFAGGQAALPSTGSPHLALLGIGLLPLWIGVLCGVV